MALTPISISSLSEHAPKRFSDSYPFAGGDPFGTYRHTFRQLVNGGLTGLTGGGATNLDGWTTVGEDVNQVFNVVSGSSIYSYVLAAGTDAQSLPDVVRPLDYASSTNEKVFRRLTPYGTVTTPGLTPPGYVVALSATTFASRTLTGTANQITVTNGDGALGNPVFSLPTSVIGVNGLTSQAANNLALATGTGTSLNITLTPGTSGAVQSVFGANIFGIDNGGPGSTPRLVSNNALQLTSSGLYALTLQGGGSGASLEVGSGANGAVTVIPAGSGSLTVGTASNGVVLYPQGLSTFAVTTTSPVDDNYHFIQVSPVITSAGGSTDIRALSIDSELAGSVAAVGNRALRLRALTSASSSANLSILQGISSSQTHQGSGLVALMSGYQGSMNLWGPGNATLVEYYRANVPNFTSTGRIMGETKGLAIYDIGTSNSTGVFGAWVDDITKPTAGSAYGYWTQMSAGAGGKWAFYGAGTAPSYFGGNTVHGGYTRWTGNSTLPGQGSMGKSATYGLNLYAATGSSYDFVVFNAAGSSLLLNPTGTTTLTTGGALSVSGVTYHPDGSTASPSVTFSADTNTGLARAATDTLEITAGGVRSALFTGTTVTVSPSTSSTNSTTGALVVNGGVGIAGNLNIGGTLGSTDIAGRVRITSGGFASYGSLTLGASYPAMGGGFQTSYDSPTTRIFYGDGSGFDLRFSTRAASATTDRITFSDAGNITATGNVITSGTRGLTRYKSANGTTASPVEDRIVGWSNTNDLLWETGMYAVNSLASNSGSWLRFKTTQTGGAAATALTLDAAQTATFAGTLIANGRVTINGGAFAAASLYKDAVFGLVQVGSPGSTSDWTVSDPTGAFLILQNPTGTQNLVAGGSLKLNGTTASTSTTTGALIVSGGVGVAGSVNAGGNLTVTGVQNVIGVATPSANFPLRLDQGATNAQVTLEVKNGSEGNSASAALQLVSDAGSSVLKQHSSIHSIWPNTLLVGGSDAVAVNTGTTADPISFWVGGQERGRITLAGARFYGTTTNDSAAAGYVGEYVSSSVAAGSALSLTTATAANVTSISLTAGDWDVTGIPAFNLSAATSTVRVVGISTTSGTFGADGTYAQELGTLTTITDQIHKVTPVVRLSLSGTTTVYLIARCTFSAGAVSAFGQIRARRVR